MRDWNLVKTILMTLNVNSLLVQLTNDCSPAQLNCSIVRPWSQRTQPVHAWILDAQKLSLLLLLFLASKYKHNLLLNHRELIQCPSHQGFTKHISSACNIFCSSIFQLLLFTTFSFLLPPLSLSPHTLLLLFFKNYFLQSVFCIPKCETEVFPV